jgi:hypothetical protein
MREREKGGNVARVAAKSFGVEQPGDRRDVSTRPTLECRHAIAQMLHRSTVAGDEPATPALRDRAALIGGDDPHRSIGGLRHRAEHQEAGDTQRISGEMTAKAPEFAFEHRALCRPLLERIEIDAAFLVVCRNFE